ncbi:hypothetical protein [Xanthomonas sp. 3498]|uniref:hypothetical protein n=1 Tax=Xanthomonas sp. 3498 TaxID=2663863 RepID=UPI001617911E|nr:hypothetical protein [Xanthomonas sp. 3498]MBB5876178.1 hypothetical protein [Xanthomonas sp. 3498]
MLIAASIVFEPYYDLWFVQVLEAKGGQAPKWRRHHPDDTPDIGARAFSSRAEAKERAALLNDLFVAAINGLTDSARRISMLLRSQKAQQSKQRLEQEELLMLDQARNRGAALQAFIPSELRLHPDSEKYREQINAFLANYPYVHSVLVGQARAWRFVQRLEDGSWSKPFWPTRTGIKCVSRARIANGFGISEFIHWGKAKAEIRRILLPDANKILMSEGVRAILADALSRGIRAVAWGPYVFWYEAAGQVGWIIKERSGSSDSEDNEALWFEGEIYSTNYGRIVVLPYVKDNGEKVRGHTKNAPHDGPALPRKPGEELVIPFEVLDGDLMFGISGEKHYE